MKKTLNWGNVSKAINTDLLDRTNITKFLDQQTIDLISERFSNQWEDLSHLKTTGKTKNNISFGKGLAKDYTDVSLVFNVYKNLICLRISNLNTKDELEIREYAKQGTIHLKRNSTYLYLHDNGDGTCNYRKENYGKTGRGSIKLLDKHNMKKSEPLKPAGIVLGVGPSFVD